MTLNFDTICRTCMTHSQALMSIFDDQTAPPNDVVSMLGSVTSIRAYKDDGLPENVCISCVAEINRAFSFKNRSERSEATLRQYLNRLATKPESQLTNPNDEYYEKVPSDEPYEIIEVIESDDRSPVELPERNETEQQDESLSNLSTGSAIDQGKVLVFTDESLPHPINVVYEYECHVCLDTFDTISLSEEHMKFHGNETDSVVEGPVDSQDVQSNDNDAEFHYEEEEAKFAVDEDDGDIVPKTDTPINESNREINELGFNVSSSLKDHIRIHNGERPYLCSICGKGFSQSTNLNQHVMRHNKTKPFQCSVCSSSFVSKGELDAHTRKHTGLHPFVCEVCGASFTTSSSLVKHTRIHTGERPYACEYCPMRFAALGTLKNHTRTHNGDRPFACGVCGRTFSQRSDCLSHQETHSGDKTFFCKQCFKSFNKKSGLRNHMKTHRKD